MRRRVLLSILLVIAASVLTLGVPLSIISWRVVPHLGKDLLAGDNLPGPAHHHPEQLELLVGQRDLDPVDLDASGRGIHPHAADVHQRRHPAAEQGADPGQQLGHPERLGDIVVGTRVQAHDEVRLVGPGGQHQYRHVPAGGPDPPAHLQPVQVR